MNELEMPDIPWFTVDERIQRLKEMGMLKWVFHVKPNPLHWDDLQNVSFTNTLEKKIYEGSTNISEETCHCPSLYTQTLQQGPQLLGWET